MTPDDFRAAVENYLVAHDETPTAFGKRVMSDPGFVFDLRRGREVKYAVQQRVMKAIQPSSRKRAA